MRTTKVRRILFTIPVSVAAVIGLAGSANAHYVYEWAEIWRSGDGNRCLQNRSEISHGNNDNGYVKGDATSLQNPEVIPTGCSYSYELPAGYLAEGLVVMKWSGTDWLICNRTDKWYTNTARTAKYQLEWYGEKGWPCGEGYYGLFNYANMRFNGEWAFSAAPALWSGQHGGLGAAAGTAPSAPAWVDENGVADPDKAPDKVKVADANGDVVLGEDGKPLQVNLTPEAPTAANTLDTKGARSVVTDEGGIPTETVRVELVRPTAAR